MSKDKRPDRVPVDELLRGGNWRMLGIGDVVTDGDYYHHYDEKYAVPAFNIGEVIRYDVHRDYFRPVNAQPTATGVPAQPSAPSAPASGETKVLPPRGYEPVPYRAPLRRGDLELFGDKYREISDDQIGRPGSKMTFLPNYRRVNAVKAGDGFEELGRDVELQQDDEFFRPGYNETEFVPNDEAGWWKNVAPCAGELTNEWLVKGFVFFRRKHQLERFGTLVERMKSKQATAEKPTAPFPERPGELVIEHVIEVSSPSGLVKARCVKNAPVFTLSTQDHDFPSDPHIFGYDEIDDLIAVLSAVRDLPR